MDRSGAGVNSAASLEQTLDAVAGTGRDLNAVTSVMERRARALVLTSADRAAAGTPARSLEGIPFAVKDVIDVAGIPTTMGSKVSSGPDPSTTAPVVYLLEQAGAMPVAKTNCQEYSYGILGDESAFGRVVNPIDMALCTGGSSSGSAALVAAGVVPLALGTDTAGSVRVPAVCQGIIGFKPSFGTVPIEGVFPLSPSFDTVGLLARDLSLLASAFAAITTNGRGSAATGRGSAEEGPGPEEVQPTAKARSGSNTTTVDLSLLDSAGDSANGARRWTELHLSECAVASARSRELTEIFHRCTEIYDVVRRYEAFVLHSQLADTQCELYQPGVWAKIMSGRAITDAEHHEQVVALEELRASAASIFDDVDFLITPAIDSDVIRWDEIGPDSAARFMRYSMPFNVLGWPAVTLPVGAVANLGEEREASGAENASERPAKPESVQIVGPPHSDERLLEFVSGLCP